MFVMLVCFVFLKLATDYYNIKERLFNKKKTAGWPKYLLRILNISHPQQLFILMLRPSHSSAQIFKINLFFTYLNEVHLHLNKWSYLNELI